MKKCIALLLCIMLLFSGISFAEGGEGTPESVEQGAKAEAAMLNEPVPSPLMPETSEFEGDGEPSVEEPSNIEGEIEFEVDEKASRKKLTVKPIDAPTKPFIRPLLSPLVLQFSANSKKDAVITITLRLGKKGKKYKVTTPTNQPAILEIPAQDINAIKPGKGNKIGLFANFAGGSGVSKLAQTKILELVLHDQQITAGDPQLALHYQRTSGQMLNIDVPLDMQVPVPGFMPTCQLVIGKAKFSSNLSAPDGSLRFALTPEQLDAIEPGGFELMFSIPESQNDNVLGYSARKIGTLTIADARSLPVYQGSGSQLLHHVGKDTDLMFPVKFVSDVPEDTTLTGWLTRKDKRYPLTLSGSIRLDGTDVGIAIAGTGLKGLKAGKYTFTFSTLGTTVNQPSKNVTREFIVGSPPNITTTRTNLPEGVTNKKYSYTLACKGSPEPVFELDSGSLPNGLGLSEAGLISGTPTKAGTFAFTVTAYNGFEPEAERRYSIKITGEDIEQEEESADVTDQTTPLSHGDELPILSTDIRAKGESVKGVATLTGLEAPTLTRLLRADSISPADLVAAIGTANRRAVPLDTSKIPSGEGVKMPLVVNNQYVGFARFLPATDKKGKAAFRFTIELISGTDFTSIQLPDGRSVHDIQLCLTQIGNAGTQSKFYTEPGALLSQTGMVFVELAVGVSYHPDSSPKYTYRRVDIAALKALAEG